MITIKQQLEWPEYLAAHYLHMRPRRTLKWVGLLFLMLLVLILGWHWMHPKQMDKTDYFVSAFVVWLLVYFFALLPYRARKIYRQNRLLHHQSEGVIDDAGLHFKTDISHSDLPWDHILKWKEGKQLILLYPNDAQFFIFPKRVFHGNDLDAFIEMLSDKVRKKML